MTQPCDRCGQPAYNCNRHGEHTGRHADLEECLRKLGAAADYLREPRLYPRPGDIVVLLRNASDALWKACCERDAAQYPDRAVRRNTRVFVAREHK